MSKQRLCVVGNGMVAARLLDELLARGGRERFDIVVFGEEPYGAYNRILLSSVLCGAHAPADIFLHPLAWYAEQAIRLHAGVRVTSIDRARRTVAGTGPDGPVVEGYDQLVLVTGSSAALPRIGGLRDGDGAIKPGVFVFRTLTDCEGIVARGQRSRRAAVVGGGLLGLEAARGLLERGLEVDVVHLMGHLMEAQLDPPAGAALMRTLQGLGLRVHLNQATSAILGDDDVEGLEFADGAKLACDLVVVAAGVRPNIELARAARLACGRGIVVGDDLATPDDPRVFALGECAEHRGQTYGLVAPLWEQARVLAERLTQPAPRATYLGSRVATKLKVAGVDLSVMGERDARAGDEEVTYSEPSRGVYKKLIVRDGRVAGAMVVGDPSIVPELALAFDRGTPAPDNRAALLFPGAADPGAGTSLADLPADAQICNCNGVSKATIVESVRGGGRSLQAVCECTRAGTGCGSCRPQVRALLELVAGEVAEDPKAGYYVSGVPLGKPALVAAIKARGLKSVSSVFAALAGGVEDARSKPGLASLLRTIWGAEYDDERDARFVNDRVHANIQRDGTFSVVPRIYGGVTTPAELRRIADVAERHGARMVKLTGGQRIDLLGIPKAELPEVWRELGMPSGHAYSKALRTCKTCVGTDFCRYGLGDSIGLGIAIERRFQGLETPHKVKLATAGCPRNCSEATTKDLGAVAVEGGRWEIYVGGAAGSRVRKGDLLCVVESHDEVLRVTGRFLQYYREHAKYQERTYDFVERVGIERLRRLLVEDAEGIAGQLDADVAASVAAGVDPWREADLPRHPTQFSGPIDVPAATGREETAPDARPARRTRVA